MTGLLFIFLLFGPYTNWRVEREFQNLAIELNLESPSNSSYADQVMDYIACERILLGMYESDMLNTLKTLRLDIIRIDERPSSTRVVHAGFSDYWLSLGAHDLFLTVKDGKLVYKSFETISDAVDIEC